MLSIMRQMKPHCSGFSSCSSPSADRVVNSDSAENDVGIACTHGATLRAQSACIEHFTFS